MKKKLLAGVLLICMLASLVGCANSSQPSSGSDTKATDTSAGAADEATDDRTAANDTGSTGDTFKIGAFLPLSGASAAYGIESRDSLQLAIDYVNDNGGFNGVNSELVTYDTQCSVEEAVKVVSKLIQEDKVDAIIGSVLSSEIFSTGNAINNAGIYTLGLGNSQTWMEEDWPYIFRAVMNSADTVPANVEKIKALGYTSVATFYGQDDASLATHQEFVNECSVQRIEVLKSESYDQGDTDYAAQVTNLVTAGADCVFISVIGETAPVIVKQLRQYGYDGVIFDRESFMASQIEIAGVENSNYIAYSIPYVTYDSIDDIDIDIIKDFAQKYMDAYGEINKTDSAYRAWDAIMVMWEASKIAGSNDSNALKDATHQISELDGLGGTINFTVRDREGYNDTNAFVLVDGKNVLWDAWLLDGGYDSYLESTGREK